jgi:hypothetical protein
LQWHFRRGKAVLQIHTFHATGRELHIDIPVDSGSQSAQRIWLVYIHFSLPPNPQLYPCSAQKRCNARETIQYNLQGAHYVPTNHKPKPLQLRCKEGINAENVCTLQCARWSGHQWETNECQTLSTQPTHLTCFCSLTSGFYR